MNEGNEIQVNKYAVLHGCLRESGEESRHFFILNIRPAKSYAEVFSHILEVAVAAKNKTLTTGSPGKGDKSVTESYDDSTTPGLSAEQGRIFKLIKDVDEEDIGIERQHIKSKVPPQLAAKVDEILDFLVSEGHIYTTRTDDHFKAT